MYQKLPSDPFISEMDPVLKMWLYQNWLGDHKDQAELAKNHAYLLGSFSNPEAVQKMMEGNSHESSEEDFEDTWKIIEESKQIELEEKETKKPKKKRKKATLVKG